MMIRISEIFGPTLQGEGALIGTPTVFVRVGGCDYRCSWCDTLYAVLPEHKAGWKPMSPKSIIDRVCECAGWKPLLVTLSGGNPALYDFAPVLELGREWGLQFTMETQGSKVPDWLGDLDFLTLSPKPPSSGMDTDYEALAECVEKGPVSTTLKVVVFDETDYRYARSVAERFPDVPMLLQVGNSDPNEEDTNLLREELMKRFDWLSGRVAADGWFDVRVMPQLHVLAWGTKRGV